MSGKHAEIVNESSKSLKPPFVSSGRNMCRCVLQNQYISTSELPNKFWRVKIGSGMGMISSGSISDTAFLNMVEEPFACKRDVQRSHGIIMYARFKDDVFILHRGPIESAMAFIEGMRVRSKFFRILVESVSRKECTMLDVHISMPCIKYNSSFLVLAPFRKPSSHWVPLRNDSMHTYHTHIAWPQAYLARLRALASTPSLQKEACKAFLAEVQAHDSQHPALKQSSNTSRKQVRGDFTFIVLPFFFGMPIRHASHPWRRKFTLIIPSQSSSSPKLLGDFSGSTWVKLSNPITGGWRGGRRLCCFCFSTL